MANEEGLASETDDEDIEVSLPDDDEEEPQESEDEQESDENDAEEEESEDETEAEEPKQEYGRRAQKRIKNLIKQRTERDRQLEELQGKFSELESKFKKQSSTQTQSQDFALKQFEERVAAEEAAIRAEWDDAYEEGDKGKLFELQRKLSRVELDRMRVDEWKRRQEATPADDDEAEAPPAQQPPQIAENLQRWLVKNPWFRKDEEMTADALEVDVDLKNAGVVVGSKEYFSEVDKRMREMYPEKFKAKSAPKASSAGHARSAGTSKKRKVIKLTSSEKATAERLGVSYEDYARQKAKLEAEQ